MPIRKVSQGHGACRVGLRSPGVVAGGVSAPGAAGLGDEPGDGLAVVAEGLGDDGCRSLEYELADRGGPAALLERCLAAHPADGAGDKDAVYRLVRRAGDLPQVRTDHAAKLMSQVGLRVSERASSTWPTSSGTWAASGKLHVRHGKDTCGSGPRERMVPVINSADRTLRWFIEDVWGQFDDHTRPGAPPSPSERKNADGSARRVGDDALRNGLSDAAKLHLPAGGDKLTSHVLRHSCTSELYLAGLGLLAIQEVLGIPGSPRRCGTSTFESEPAAG